MGSVVVVHGLSCPTACGIFWTRVNHWTIREITVFLYIAINSKNMKFLINTIVNNILK